MTAPSRDLSCAWQGSTIKNVNTIFNFCIISVKKFTLSINYKLCD